MAGGFGLCNAAASGDSLSVVIAVRLLPAFETR
jgi:hypothetical protein